ncbi:MAG: GNAT family N-acetyltransferase [Gammaproteobacteria bacterium]|nr:MAG: GNAT family N-acetyltransferase [Gammaproteobacteria bacterium]
MTRANADTVELAPATPDHPGLVAELIHATEPHIFGYLHDHDMHLVRSHLGYQWQQPDSLFSHRFCTAALLGEELMGIELGFDVVQQQAAAGPMVAYAEAHMSEAQFAHFATWFDYGRFVLPSVPDDAWYLQHLAVVPAARGRGVGERLLANAIERSRQAGYGRIHLDVYAANPAVRLYERGGFEVIVETLVRPLEQHGIPLHWRMERKL